MREIQKPDGTLAKLLPPVQLLPDAAYVPSQFTLRFEHRGKRYAYNTLTGQCLETELPERCGAGEGYDPLIERRFLVPEGKDECGFYSALSSLLRVYGRQKGSRGFTLMPTLDCNARCVYCYEKGMKRTAMAPETVEQTIRFIAETHAGDSVSLHWFGGEPLLRPDIIDRVCEGLREAGLPYRSTMITNGSLITPGTVAKMNGLWNLDKIQISMDGAESDYIARKRYYSYRDDYHRVLEAAGMTAAAGIRTGIRCNVDEENADGVPAFIEDVRKQVPRGADVTLRFAPLYGIRSGENDLRLWKKVLALIPLAEAAGLTAAPLFGKERDYRVSHCMADGSGVVIAPDGSLYSCEHCPPESRFGNIWQGVTDEKARREFCRTDRIREKCRTCPFLPDCTTFSSCPIQDYHCREVRELLKMSSLRRLADRLDRNADDEEESSSSVKENQRETEI